MGDLFQNFIEDVKRNYPKNKDKVLSALEFADKSHEGIKRKSGEPYHHHLIEVAYILSTLQCGPTTIAAGLLHDVVEDTEVGIDVIEIYAPEGINTPDPQIIHMEDAFA